MRQKMLFASGLMMLVTMLIVMNGMPVSAVQNETDLLAGRPSLQSYKIYFTEMNNEASRFDRSNVGLSRLAGLLQRLGAELYTLEWRNPIPVDANLIVVAGPINDLTGDQTARLWSYLNNNGRLLVLAEPLADRVRALPADEGLFALTWTDMSIRAREDVLVIEDGMQTVQVPSEEEVAEGTPVPTPQFTEAPILVSDFVTTNIVADHPLMQGVTGELAFFRARSLEVDESLQIAEALALAFSNEEFYGETRFSDYLDNGLSDYNMEEDSVRGIMPLIAVSTNPETGARLVLIGDRDFATNGGGFQTSPPNSPSFLYPDNVQVMLNAITWLLDADASEVSFPTPGATSTATVTATPTPEMTATPEPEGETAS
jgi:hypothetical protein